MAHPVHMRWRLLVKRCAAATVRTAHELIDHTSHPLQLVVCDAAQIRLVGEWQVCCNIQGVDRVLDLAYG